LNQSENDINGILSMQKVKHVKIGDYVFVSKYSDKDPYDPWNIGLICEYGVDTIGHFYKVNAGRQYRHVWKIEEEEAKLWIQQQER